MIAVDKPAGFYTMPSEDKNLAHSFHWDSWCILQKQKGMKLYPVHRLDRATSGLLIFSKQRELNRELQMQFLHRQVEKTYICVVRGALNGGSARIDSPLKKDDGTFEEALTTAETLVTFSLPIPGPKGPDREFSILKVSPETGRYHQIRRHFAGISFPLVGDRTHGDSKVNRAFRELTKLDSLFLRCMEMKFKHPGTQEPMALRARYNPMWHQLFEKVGVCAKLF
jgi:tRNA pseudouridine65 synthase